MIMINRLGIDIDSLDKLHDIMNILYATVSEPSKHSVEYHDEAPINDILYFPWNKKRLEHYLSLPINKLRKIIMNDPIRVAKYTIVVNNEIKDIYVAFDSYELIYSLQSRNIGKIPVKVVAEYPLPDAELKRLPWLITDEVEKNKVIYYLWRPEKKEDNYIIHKLEATVKNLSLDEIIKILNTREIRNVKLELKHTPAPQLTHGIINS